ncbi:MAG: hypothetical protein KBC64_03250 [Simkaniaceae bacterium]|nr:hypothetical protein [Simkaniaceae bacterium]
MSIQEKLLLIPDSDRIHLEWFFRYLIGVDGWGYSLFGEKATSLSGYFQVEPLDNIMCWNYSSFIKRGWETYESLFPHPHYIIGKEFYKENIISIYLINKKNAKISINKHKETFLNELHDFYSAESLLKKIEEIHSLYASLDQHEGLLGIMLGFGPKSSLNYHKRHLVLERKKNLHLKNLILKEVSYKTRETVPYVQLRSVSFMGDPSSSEAQSILKQNRQDRKTILKYYSQGNFLEITLQKLTEF